MDGVLGTHTWRRRAHNQPPVRKVAGHRLDPLPCETYRAARAARSSWALLKVVRLYGHVESNDAAPLAISSCSKKSIGGPVARHEHGTTLR